MINSMQWAIIKKDLKTLVLNKRLFPVLLILPFMFSVFLPLLFIITLQFMPESSADFQELLRFIPIISDADNLRLSAISAIINVLVPVFFILIPTMVSSVMAASSFVGEKEKRTLETLLYSPIPLKKIFQSKVFSAVILSVSVSFLSFLLMVVVVQVSLFAIANTFATIDPFTWVVILLLLAPSISLLSVTLIVSGSAKAQTVEESQQRSAFLILPVFLLLAGQFSGVLLLSPLLLVLLAVLFLVLALWMMKRVASKFTYEALLK